MEVETHFNVPFKKEISWKGGVSGLQISHGCCLSMVQTRFGSIFSEEHGEYISPIMHIKSNKASMVIFV